MKIWRVFDLAFGYFVKVVGFVLYLVGVVGVVLMVLLFHKLFQFKLEEIAEVFWVGLAVIIVVIASFFLGQILLKFANRYITRSNSRNYNKNVSKESERIALYLRTFSDDKLTAKIPAAAHIEGIPLPALSSEEEHLRKVLMGIGEFLALAQPNQQLPEAGALKLEIHEKWQSTVIQLLKSAKLVVIRVGQGGWLWWEVEQALATVEHKKIVFLIPKDDTEYPEFRRRLANLVGRDIPSYYDIETHEASVGAIVSFTHEGIPYLRTLGYAEYLHNPTQPLFPMLRIAMKPVYDQLEIPWKSPSVPFVLYPKLIFHIYVFILTGGGSILMSFAAAMIWSEKLISIGIFVVSAMCMFASWRHFRWLKESWLLLFRGRRQEKKYVDPIQISFDDPKIIQFYQNTLQAWIKGDLSHIDIPMPNSWQEVMKKFRPNQGSAMYSLFVNYSLQSHEYLVALYNETSIMSSGSFVLTNLRLLQRCEKSKKYYDILLEDIMNFEISGIYTFVVTFVTKGERISIHTAVCPDEKVLNHFIQRARSDELALIEQNATSEKDDLNLDREINHAVTSNDAGKSP